MTPLSASVLSSQGWDSNQHSSGQVSPSGSTKGGQTMRSYCINTAAMTILLPRAGQSAGDLIMEIWLDIYQKVPTLDE